MARAMSLPVAKRARTIPTAAILATIRTMAPATKQIFVPLVLTPPIAAARNFQTSEVVHQKQRIQGAIFHRLLDARLLMKGIHKQRDRVGTALGLTVLVSRIW